MSSAFDRPVTMQVYAANPWPFAQAAMRLGAEVLETDMLDERTAIVVDLDALDRLFDLERLRGAFLL